jgi:hypothetical protein
MNAVFDILLHGSAETVVRRRWWLAVISGAVAAAILVCVFHIVRLLLL